MKVEVEYFKTIDGGDTIGISPSGSRRQKPEWHIWMKDDGSGILVIDSEKKRISLPANSPKKICQHDMEKLSVDSVRNPERLKNLWICKKCTKEFRRV